MKLKIKQNILLEHLNYVIRGISNKNLIPILNCIKFELNEEGLYLSSTDNEISIKTFIRKENIDEINTLGEIVISGRYIYEIIKKLPNEIIDIEEVMDAKIFINTKNSSFNLNCNIVGDFPDIGIENKTHPIIITEKVLKNMINQTSFAASNQESRPVLTGVNIKINKSILECCATDSYRLAIKRLELKQETDEKINIIVPTKSILELLKLLNNDNSEIEIHVFQNKVVFKFDSIIMMSRLINGSYPDTSKLIPESFQDEIEVNLKEFYNAIDRASLLTNENDKNTLKFYVEKNKLVLSSNIPEIGNVEEKINVKNKNSNIVKIAFSSKFMLDALKTMECETIKILLNGEIKPIIIKNPESNDMTQLILPIRTY